MGSKLKYSIIRGQTLFERMGVMALMTFSLGKLANDSNPIILIESDHTNYHNGIVGYILQWLFEKMMIWTQQLGGITMVT